MDSKLGSISTSKNHLDDGSFDVQPVTETKEYAKGDGATNLDVCFMIDVTGSMQSYIDRTRNKIKDIVKEVCETYPESLIRLSIVGYRDVQDHNRFDILDFTDDGERARIFLDGIRASGGGDTPEDVNGGFQKALWEINWDENAAKMIIHIADAPCHGKEFHNTNDNHPNMAPGDKPYADIFKRLIELHIDYLFLKLVENMTDKMFNKFLEIAEGQGLKDSGLSFKQEPVTASTIQQMVVPMGHALPVKKRSTSKEKEKERDDDKDKKDKKSGDKDSKSDEEEKDDKNVKGKKRGGKKDEREREKEKDKPIGHMTPAMMAGMTAAEEQEYFAKLLAEEMKGTIDRKLKRGGSKEFS